MLLQTDARRRITLPPMVGINPGDAISLELLEDGRIMLIPVEAVPKHQLPQFQLPQRALLRDRKLQRK